MVYHRDGAVARIEFVNAPHGNSIDLQFARELEGALGRAHADAARVIVLTARGPNFSFGGDISAFGAAEDIGGYVDDLVDALNRAVSELMRSPAIVLAAVRGVAAGAAFPLAASADVLVAARSARFTLGHTKLGFSVDGGTSLLVHTLGLHRTLRLALLNDFLTAQEAQRAGLVARLCEDHELDDVVDELAQRISVGPMLAQGATKKLLRLAAEDSPESVIREEALMIRERAADPDGVEGVRAFLDKRPCEFR